MSTSRAPLPSSLLLALLAPLTLLLSGCGGDLFDRLSQPQWGLCGTVIIILDILALLDLLGDEGRSVTSKVVWALLIIFFPVGGVILYFFLGRE